jgi:ParB-like chromosome segregation protein Spo0J
MSDLIKISKLKEHPKNPRVHTSEQIQKIASSIQGNGWGRPIIISKDYYILAGHGAVQAALKLKRMEVPYKYLEPQRNHDEPEAIAYMIADNKTTDESDWNYGKLDIVFDDLKLKGFDMELTGFDDTSLNLSDQEIPNEEPEYDETIAMDIEKVKCPRCDFEFPI